MKRNLSNTVPRSLRRAALALVCLGIAAAPAVHAKPRSKSADDTSANVVAHVPVSGGTAKRMLLVKKGNREYLVLGLESASGIAIFDVSDPAKPRAIDVAAIGARANTTEVTLIADTLALFGDAATSQEMKEIRSLSGVTASIKVRGMIYATNADGLWIVKTKQKAAADDAPSDNYGS